MRRSSDDRFSIDRIEDWADWLVTAPFDGTVRWHKHVGDVVAPGEAVVTVTGEQGSRDCQNPLDADAVVTGIYREHDGSVNKGTPLFMLSLHRAGWRELSTETEGLRVGLMHVPTWELFPGEPLIERPPDKPRSFAKPEPPPALKIPVRPSEMPRPQHRVKLETPAYTPPPKPQLPPAPNVRVLRAHAEFSCLTAKRNVVMGIWLLSLFLACSAEASIWARIAAHSLALFALFAGTRIVRPVTYRRTWFAAVGGSLGLALCCVGLTLAKDSGPGIAHYFAITVLFSMTPTMPGYLHGLAAVVALRHALYQWGRQGPTWEPWWIPAPVWGLVKRVAGQRAADAHLWNSAAALVLTGIVTAVVAMAFLAASTYDFGLDRCQACQRILVWSVEWLMDDPKLLLGLSIILGISLLRLAWHGSVAVVARHPGTIASTRITVTAVLLTGVVAIPAFFLAPILARIMPPFASIAVVVALLPLLRAWHRAELRFADKTIEIDGAERRHALILEYADRQHVQETEEAWQQHQRAVEEAETRYATAVEEAERHYKRTVEERERQHVRAVESARALHAVAMEKHFEELRLIEASNRSAQEMWLRESSLSLDRSERIWKKFNRLEDEYALPTFFSLRLPPSERFVEVVGGTRLGWKLLARQIVSGLRERASQLAGGGPIFVIDVSDLNVGDECVKSLARTKTQPMSSLAGALAAWTLQTRGGADALAGLLATSLAGAHDPGMSALVWHRLLVDIMAAVGNEMTLPRFTLALRILAGEIDGEAEDWDDTLAERVRRVASRSRSASLAFLSMCSQTAALLRRLPDGTTGMPALGVVSIAGSLRHTSDQQIARLALQGLELWLAGTSGREKSAGLVVLGSELLSRSDCDGLRRACQKAATPLVLFFGDLPVDGASLVAGPSSVLLAMRATNGHVASTLAALIGRERRVEVMSYTRQHGRTASSGHQTSRQEGGSHSTGTGRSATTGSSLSVGLSEGASTSKTQSRSQGESLSEGESFSESEHSSKSESLSEGTSGARTTNTTNDSSSDTSGTNATKTTGATTGTSTSRGTSSTRSTSNTEGESTTDGTSTTHMRTEGTQSSKTSSTSEADTDNWGVSSGENESIGTNESVSVTQQRTLEFVVEPSRLQRLPDDVFLVVSHADSGRGDIVVGYCDPALESLWCDAPGGRLVPHPGWRATRDDVFFVTTGGTPRSEAWACRGLRGGLDESKS